MTFLHDHYQISRGRAAARTTVRLRMPTAPAKKEVGYFSAMPADGMTAAHSPGEDFGTSRSKRQLFKGYAISRALERRLIAASYGSQPCLDGRHPSSPQVYPLDMRLICPNRNERQPQSPLCRFMVSSPLFGTLLEGPTPIADLLHPGGRSFGCQVPPR